jgi:hypothetical protein
MWRVEDGLSCTTVVYLNERERERERKKRKKKWFHKLIDGQ